MLEIWKHLIPTEVKMFFVLELWQEWLEFTFDCSQWKQKVGHLAFLCCFKFLEMSPTFVIHLISNVSFSPGIIIMWKWDLVYLQIHVAFNNISKNCFRKTLYTHGCFWKTLYTHAFLLKRNGCFQKTLYTHAFLF